MKLPIVKYGNPILRAKGKRIEQVDERIRSLAADMLETMHAANGIGLAAQQVGAALQLTVLDVSQVEDRPSTMKVNGTKVDPASAMPSAAPISRLASLTAEATPCLSSGAVVMITDVVGAVHNPIPVLITNIGQAARQ